MVFWRDEGSSVCWARAQAKMCGALVGWDATKSLFSSVSGVVASAYGVGKNELARSVIVWLLGSVDNCWTALC